jgi:adenylate kinase family enzyme
MSRPQAILLLGPTGSGKTPLGEMLQARGLGAGRCMHFDFGGRLRRIASGQLNVAELTGDDRALIAEMIDRGALLEDEHFHVAEKILRAFLAEPWHGRPAHECHGHPRKGSQGLARESQGRPGPANSDHGRDGRDRDAHATIVLNGLPRHVGQADDVDRIVTVRLVIELSCSAETIRRRLADDAGGDRADRIDDDPARVHKKLELYTRRTKGLLDHYRSLGVAAISLIIEPDTTAQDAWRDLLGRQISHAAKNGTLPGSGESEDAGD